MLRSRRLVPWLLVLVAIPVALLGLEASAPTACSQLPGAFSSGVTTEQSDTLGVVASHCETTRSGSGTIVEETIVNWSGLVASIALLFGAWVVGALAVNQVSRRTGGIGIALVSITMVGALGAFFV